MARAGARARGGAAPEVELRALEAEAPRGPAALPSRRVAVDLGRAGERGVDAAVLVEVAGVARAAAARRREHVDVPEEDAGHAGPV